ncbi:MAG: hypothetical protein VX000_08020, partial [Myxococcota bacterium]|nr:hypothetical protein [Myxococcota bacterium]
PETPAAAAPAPVAAPAPTPEPAPEPEPEPEPPKEVVNADLNVRITRADGSTVQGHVKRIERSKDFFGETEWINARNELTIQVEGPDVYTKILWTEVDRVFVKPGAVPADVDCSYDSNFRPWMYECVLKTTGSLVMADGKKVTVDNRHKWRFTFDDDTAVEFWLKKHVAREQDASVVDLDTDNPENYDLYKKLQQQLRDDVKGSMVIKVDIE